MRLKNKFLLAVACVAFLPVAAQNYYMLPSTGGNPNTSSAVNTESDDAGLNGTGGWTIALDSVKTTAVSKSIFLPFDFSFAGSNVVALKASSTGFVTFDTGILGNPPLDLADIPTSKLPNKTIAIWGITGSGSNDQILTKTFGTAPNRQFWIKYASYSTPLDTQGAWNYWAVVLEESTNRIHLVGMYMNQAGGVYQSPEMVIGVQETNLLGTMVPRNSTKNFSLNTNAADDNFFYTFQYGTQANSDAALNSISGATVVKGGNPLTFSLHMQNRGTATLDSLRLYYQVNGGAIIQENYIGLGLKNGAYSTLSLTNPTTAAVAGNWNHIKAWVSHPNGNVDTVNGNDTSTWSVLSVNMSYTKRNVLLEMGTGTWCEFCPDADRKIKDLQEIYGDSMIVAKHHSLDEMQGNGDSLNIAFYSTLPGTTMNRHYWSKWNGVAIHRDSLAGYISGLYTGYNPAKIVVSDVSLDTVIRKFSFTVNAIFTDYCPGKITLGGMAVEDVVRGTGPGFSQKISSEITGSSSHYFSGFTSPIIGYYHEKTVWNMPGSVFGVSPATSKNLYAPGDTAKQSFTYTYPALVYKETLLGSPYLPIGDIITRFKPMDMSAIGFLAIPGNGSVSEIANTAEQRLWDLTLGVSNPAAKKLTVYPNPAKGAFYVETGNLRGTLTFTTLTGKEILSTTLSGNENIISMSALDLQLTDGVYLLQVRDQQGNQHTAKVLFTR